MTQKVGPTHYIPETFDPHLGEFDQPPCWYVHRNSTNETWWIETTKLKNEFLRTNRDYLNHKDDFIIDQL